MTQPLSPLTRIPACLATAAVVTASALPAFAQGPEATTTAASAAITSFAAAQSNPRAVRQLTLAAFDRQDAAPAALNLQLPEADLKPATPPPVRPHAEWLDAPADGFQIYNFKARYRTHF